MDECEAVANRIGIMRQGELVCLGTAQHLKSRFAGYFVQIKAKNKEFLSDIRAKIPGVFRDAEHVDEHGGIITE